MLTIKTDVDLRGLRSLLDGFSDRRYRSTIATALTRTAKIAQREVVKEIGRVFDRPTRWALNSTYLQPADKDRLAASVWLKDRHGAPQAKDSHYLYPEVFGVARGRKAYETALLRVGALRSNEFTVPAKAMPLDANGNLPVGIVRTILSQLEASGSAGQGYSSNKTDSARSRRTVAKRGTYFVPRPGSGLPRGIYRRTRSGGGWTTEMVLKIVVGKPAYRTRLRLFDIGRRVQAEYLQREFDRAYDASAARLAARDAQ
jgi:hypothetical protein